MRQTNNEYDKRKEENYKLVPTLFDETIHKVELREQEKLIGGDGRKYGQETKGYRSQPRGGVTTNNCGDDEEDAQKEFDFNGDNPVYNEKQEFSHWDERTITITVFKKCV